MPARLVPQSGRAGLKFKVSTTCNPYSSHYSLAQTPGPDLVCQDAVMESEALISNENSCISTSRRTRAGWLTGPEFHRLRFRNITATIAHSRQVAPGQANTPPLQLGRSELNSSLFQDKEASLPLCLWEGIENFLTNP